MSKETFRHDRGTRVALVKSRWLNSMHLGAKMASVAYNLLAALHRDPAWRSLRSVARLAEHARPARGASWLAARRPQRGGKARLLPLTVVAPVQAAEVLCDLRQTASRSVASVTSRTSGIIAEMMHVKRWS